MVDRVRRLEDRPLSYRRAMERIRTLWNEGLVEIDPYHAQVRMRERGFDMLDLEHLIRYGRVVEHSKPGRLWRYKVEGTSVEGERAACVVEIKGHRIVIVTVEWIRSP